MAHFANKVMGVAILLGSAWGLASPLSNVFDYALAGAFVVAAVLVATLAEVITEPGGLRYRRGFRWRYVAYKDIRGFGRAFAWYYLKLPRQTLPWGVVFIAPSASFRWPNPLFVEIRRGIDRAHGPSAEARANRRPANWSIVTFFLLLGAGATALVFFLAPPGLPAVVANLPGRGLPKHHLIVIAGPFFWGALGIIYLALALFGRRPRLYGFCSGVVFAWLTISIPIIFR